MPYLSKSNFQLGYTCPQKLLYQAQPSLYFRQKIDDAVESSIYGGHQIGALAQTMFLELDDGAAFEIDDHNQSAQIASTQAALEAENVTLFEPTIVFGKCLARIDVLRKRGQRIELIEVKSKSFDSIENPGLQNPKDHEKYLRDLAFQYWVVSHAYPDWDIDCFLMMPDKTRHAKQDFLHQCFPVQERQCRGGDRTEIHVRPAEKAIHEKLGESFLTQVNVNEHVQEVLKREHSIPEKHPSLTGSFSEIINALAETHLNASAVQEPPIGSHCRECEFYLEDPADASKSGFHQCWKQALKTEGQFKRSDTILGLYSPASSGKMNMRNLFNAGYRWLNQLDPIELGLDSESSGPLTIKNRQRMQITGHWPGQAKNDQYYFDRDGFIAALDDALATTGWPLYFLDFEAASSPLPLRAGQKPNAIHVFQYSIHAMEQDGTVTHHSEYIDLSNDSEVNVKMLRQLKEDLGQQGTIFRWHHYENNRLNELRAQLLEASEPRHVYGELIEFVESLTQRKENKKLVHSGDRNMIDQAEWASQFYFHPATQGSSSIKVLLPAVMSSSAFLKNRYSQRIYGTDAFRSHNFANHVWWVSSEDGDPINPYQLLGANQNEDIKAQPTADDGAVVTISEGGAAMSHYVQCQSGRFDSGYVRDVEDSLLKYCELDTLAMVMIMQAWMSDAGCLPGEIGK